MGRGTPSIIGLLSFPGTTLNGLQKAHSVSAATL